MVTIYAILIFAAILMQAFFTASEMAFTTVNRNKLKSLVESGDRRANKLYNFLRKEGVYLGVTLVGTNMAVVISSISATRVFGEYFGHKTSPLITILVMVPLTLILAEIIPKMIARQFSMGLALNTVVPASSFYRLFYPLIFVVSSIARFFLKPFAKNKSTREIMLTKTDLKKVLLLGYKTGEVEEDEVERIHKILDLGAKIVEKIMVPLYRVSSVSRIDTISDLKKLVSLTGFSRIPVYKNHKNNILGIVNIYDILFSRGAENQDWKAGDFMRDAVYVNKKDRLDIALARLRHKKQPMGIVVEEKNMVVGIVTIEDILEEIVGEIGDGD
ncbi:MAG: hemolysin family protein [Candidatus Omnitrophota bacterium]